MPKTENIGFPNLLHKFTVASLYLLAIIISWKILHQPDAQNNLITLLTTGAIIATFGSALSTIGSILERDLLERTLLNIEIFYKDIIKQEVYWRRWPFLSRVSQHSLLDGSINKTELQNPMIPINVGTHVIKIALPTVLEDFFDLPLVKNLFMLIRYRKATRTFLGNQEKDIVDKNSKMDRSDAYMAYECLLDIWFCVMKFRIARYLSYFGIGLTLSATIFTAFYAFNIY